ncbi:uncharacterized protein KY384_007324 [Bacidia gigantensis]|uniref:uncharacterized protein n=1 Tax=Bacidia gigantensis TaxID=2732470 RepID=UPI001D04CBBD|nr:uncharacterized protein KY384_007324 [Bacidia gigantensis]KAG8528406.1 hypothetical protein KY384_007324 [Bacidia gigantensis]
MSVIGLHIFDKTGSDAVDMFGIGLSERGRGFGAGPCQYIRRYRSAFLDAQRGTFAPTFNADIVATVVAVPSRDENSHLQNLKDEEPMWPKIVSPGQNDFDE